MAVLDAVLNAPPKTLGTQDAQANNKNTSTHELKHNRKQNRKTGMTCMVPVATCISSERCEVDAKHMTSIQ